MRGRKPLPTWRRQLDGNPGKRPMNVDEPQPPATAALLDPPPELADHPLALKEWARLAPMLYQARQATDADRAALVALCLEWERYLEATARVKTSGLVVQTPNGYPMPNPFLSIATKALSACTKLWPELGLTPSSRSRLKTQGAPPEDAFSEFDQPLDPPGTSRH